MVRAFFERNEERIKTTAFVLNTLNVIILVTIGLTYFFIL